MEIVKIDERSWRMEEKGVRFFLLTGTERALLIDSGMLTHDAREIAESITTLPVSLVNTHGDPDHIGSNAEFKTFYMHPAETVNYYNCQKGKGRFIPVDDGYIFDIGKRRLKVISIPGHTPGSIALLDESNRVLISGDTVQNGNIYMFGLMREFHAYIESLRKLSSMKSSFDMIWPSHGTFPVKPEIIDVLIESAEKHLRNELECEEIEIRGQKILRENAIAAHFLCGK